MMWQKLRRVWCSPAQVCGNVGSSNGRSACRGTPHVVQLLPWPMTEGAAHLFSMWLPHMHALSQVRMSLPGALGFLP